MNDVLHVALIMVVGVVAGVANTIAGGGSLIVVPSLILLGLPATVANATSRPAILTQNVVAWLELRRRGTLEEPGAERLAWSHALITVPSGLVGAFVATHWTSDVVFSRLLAVVLLVMLVLTLRRRRGDRPRGVLGRRGLAFALVGVGFYGGFIQAGVGFVIMSLLMSATHWPVRRINAEKVLMVGAYTLATLVVFAGSGSIVWPPALALVVAQSIGGHLGARLSTTLSESVLLRVYAVLLAVFAAALIFTRR